MHSSRPCSCSRKGMLPPTLVSRGVFGFGEVVTTPKPQTSLRFGFASLPPSSQLETNGKMCFSKKQKIIIINENQKRQEIDTKMHKKEQMTKSIKMRNVGAQTQKKWRPRGPPPEGWGPEGGGPNISRFFPSPATNVRSFSLSPPERVGPERTTQLQMACTPLPTPDLTHPVLGEHPPPHLVHPTPTCEKRHPKPRLMSSSLPSRPTAFISFDNCSVPSNHTLMGLSWAFANSFGASAEPMKCPQLGKASIVPSDVVIRTIELVARTLKKDISFSRNIFLTERKLLIGRSARERAHVSQVIDVCHSSCAQADIGCTVFGPRSVGR